MSTTVIESRIDLDDAVRAVLADIRPLEGAQTVPVDQACGRVAAEQVCAPRDLPPFPASAMDGYALRSRDVEGPPPYVLPVAGTSFAGRPLDAPVPAGACARIFTGAVLPNGLDAVVLQEDCERRGGQVVIHQAPAAGDNVRPAGHDVTAGSRLLDSGEQITAFSVGWLAACGIPRVRVRPRPVIGIVSTGDELVEPGGELGSGQIFDANRPMLRALLGRLPVVFEDFGIAADDPDVLRATLERAGQTCDAILTSGGVSVGDADRVRDVVAELGELRLWKLNLKPGKPLSFGRLGRAAFFGLPGNPVSAALTALMLVKPALERLAGTEPVTPLPLTAVAGERLRHRAGREEFQRGTLAYRDGRLEVTVTGDQSSNRLSSFSDANCLVRIPKACGDVAQGSAVTVLPFTGLL